MVSRGQGAITEHDLPASIAEMPQIVRQLLEIRGIPSDGIEEFFNPSLTSLVAPDKLPGIVEAAEVMLAAVAAREKIVVFGDYDCDGVCATAIAIKTLRALLGEKAAEEAEKLVVPFIPDRLSEGYGMSERSVARMLSENPGVTVVITVDNGVNAIDRVSELKAKGIKVVVTDHHLPSETLPAADAVVDPKVAAPPEFQSLCGAGVMYLLASRMISEAKRRGTYTGGDIGGPLLVLAGLATVTDIMPLTGQNRIIVAEALRHFHAWSPIGLQKLLERAARTAAVQMTSKDFSFTLGPRINAAGRMASSMQSLELIMSDDIDIANESARIIDLYNIKRKTIEQKMTEKAVSLIVPGAPAQVIDLPDGHPGVAGIVAARVMERIGVASGMKVPVCVIAGGHGSARSPEYINIRDAMEACRDALDRYGGHAAAGGFSVKEDMTDEFRRRLCEYCEKFVRNREVLPRAAVGGAVPDLWVDSRDMTLNLAEWIARMDPFGEANPEPLFGIKGLHFTDVRPLGHDGKHLAISFSDRNCPRAVWWNHGGMVDELRQKSACAYDIVFTLGVSEYGERHAEIRLAAIQSCGV